MIGGLGLLGGLSDSGIMQSLITRGNITIQNPYLIGLWQHVLDPLSGYLPLAKKTVGKCSCTHFRKQSIAFIRSDSVGRHSHETESHS